MASAAVIEAFDRLAPVYDQGFGRNPAGLIFRYVFQERVRTVFPRGSRVLDLGCGTGDDALFLASQGVFVHAVDASGEMIERARSKAEARGIPEAQLRFERVAAEDLVIDGRYDGAYSDFGALNCADLQAVGRVLTRALRPGAWVLLSFMGRWPLPALLERALLGRGERRGARSPRVAGLLVPTRYYALGEARALLGDDFRWQGAFALGALMPGPEHEGWARRNPQGFGFLAALEGIVRRWPVLRSLGDHVVLEGVRR